MTARSFNVSFRTGPLTDREVDALADVLWDHGADTITFRPLPEQVSREEYEQSLQRVREHYSRADSTADRDALRAAAQHDVQRSLKW